MLVHFLERETRADALAQELRNKDEALRQLKYNLNRARKQMKVYVAKKRKNVHYKVGEWVFLKLRPYKQHFSGKRIYKKLVPRFFGPYKIV